MEYINGPKNIVTDTLSPLEMTSDTESLDMADCYGLDSDDLPDNAFLISYTLIDHEQKKDKTLLKQAQTRSYSLKKFHGDKICMMMTRLACNRAIESSYWRMDNDSDVGLLTGYVLYRLPVELEFMDLDTFPR